MLDPKKKQDIIKKFQLHKDDTGSSEVQIAILTAEIEELSEHLKKHYHDFSSRRGLLKKISQRRRLIKYLAKENPESLEKLAKKLKIRVNLPKKQEDPLGEEETSKEAEPEV